MKTEKSVEEFEPVYQEEELGENFKQSYLDYSLSVIVERAIPDVIDGCKPSNRRLFHTMYENGLLHGRRMKCARIVGDVIGKYHPHGDASVYDVLVGNAQPFNNNVPVVDPQGNFGSLDGDSPAAMRYTEAKLSPIAQHIMSDIDYVEMQDNYDQTLKEPKYLPVEFPYLLLNGTSGIAVGMATNIPPHSLREICDATIAYIKDNNITTAELCKHIKGIDLPTGGMLAKEDFVQTYETGRGPFSVRSHIDLTQRGKHQCLIIRDLPYNVNKSKLIETIAYISRDNKEKKNGVQKIIKAKIEGIKDITDESNLQNPVSIVIMLEKDASPELIVNQLYKHTACNVKYNLNMRVLVNGKPKLIGIKNVFEEFLPFRRSIISDKLCAERIKIEKRLHIIDGFFLVFDKIKQVIKTIEEYAGDDLNGEIQKVFNLTKEQAVAVLAITLKKLSKIDKFEINTEYTKLKTRKNEIDTILSDVSNVDDIIIEELTEIRKKFGTQRKTELASQFSEINQLDTIPEESMIITLSANGFIKRTSLSEYKTQNRKGVGVNGGKTEDDDYIKFIKTSNSHDDILFFTNTGSCYYLPVYMIPEMDKNRKGTKVAKLINLADNEKIAAMLSIDEMPDDKTLVLTSKKGYTKRLDVACVKRVRKSGLIVAKVAEGDELLDVAICDELNEILLSTKAGFSLRIKASEISIIGRTGRGVGTVKLRGNDDCVISMCVVNSDDEILTVTERGYGKKVSINEYRLVSGHSGKGVTNYKVDVHGNVAGVKSVSTKNIKQVEIIIITNTSKIIRIPFDSFTSSIGRATKGCRLQAVGKNEIITAFDIINVPISE